MTPQETIDTLSDIIGEDITARRRTARICNARNVAAYLLHADGLSQIRIGHVLHRDRITARHALIIAGTAIEHPAMYPDFHNLLAAFRQRAQLQTI